jgi:protein-S-isoprenylcysteine O-methyltransferase Ste14
MAGTAELAGAALAVASLALLAWATWQLRRAGTASATAELQLAGLPAPAHQRGPRTAGMLLDEGPYAFSRNPQYLGLVGLLAGLAMAHASTLLALAAAGLALTLNAVLIPREEALLARRHGGWWRDYRSQVRRWL